MYLTCQSYYPYSSYYVIGYFLCPFLHDHFMFFHVSLLIFVLCLSFHRSITASFTHKHSQVAKDVSTTHCLLIMYFT